MAVYKRKQKRGEANAFAKDRLVRHLASPLDAGTPTVTERGGEQQGVIICQCVPITDLCEVPPRTLARKTERRPANER